MFFLSFFIFTCFFFLFSFFMFYWFFFTAFFFHYSFSYQIIFMYFLLLSFFFFVRFLFYFIYFYFVFCVVLMSLPPLHRDMLQVSGDLQSKGSPREPHTLSEYYVYNTVCTHGHTYTVIYTYMSYSLQHM